MKYMLLIYGNDETWAAMHADAAAVARAHAELVDELTGSGELLGTQGLTTVDARTVRERDGSPVITDGPFIESREVLAGYYLVDCASLERATEIAARLPELPFSPVEVRRVME